MKCCRGCICYNCMYRDDCSDNHCDECDDCQKNNCDSYEKEYDDSDGAYTFFEED